MRAFLSNVRTALYYLKVNYWKPLRFQYGNLGNNSYIRIPSVIEGAHNIFLGDNVRIQTHSKILAVGEGRIIIKDNVGCAMGLTMVASNHRQKPGAIRNGINGNSDNEYKDIIIEEDVWIGANVTLLAGSHIGRGAIIGAGSVIRNQSIPPYSVVVGNPVKIIRFKFKLEDIIEHEKMVYPPEKRISEDLLIENYNRYFLNRKEEIGKYRSLI